MGPPMAGESSREWAPAMTAIQSAAGTKCAVVSATTSPTARAIPALHRCGMSWFGGAASQTTQGRAAETDGGAGCGEATIT